MSDSHDLATPPSPNVGQLIERAGGPSKVGRMVGASSQAVGQWKKVPDVHVLAIAAGTRELAAKGELERALTPHEIRRDLYPHPDDGLPDELRKGRRKR